MPRKILRNLRRKTRSVNVEGDSCVREPQVQQEIVNITAVKNDVEEWARELIWPRWLLPAELSAKDAL